MVKLMPSIFELSDFIHALKELRQNHSFGCLWVAHSGGADSTALVYAVNAATKFLESSDVENLWGIYHFNFGLRGEDSQRDEEFSRGLAQKFGVSFKVVHAANPPKTGIQNWARSIRNEHWVKIDQSGDAIALGHHLDDVAENMLFRMARGTSPEHLTGLKTWRKPLWRPFLGVQKSFLIEWLQELGVTFRHDASNDKIDYARNKIRHQVLPVLEQLFPGAAVRIASLGLSIQDRENRQHQDSLQTKIMKRLQEYYQQKEIPTPQISKAWVTEAQKILQNPTGHQMVRVPQSTGNIGPFQNVLTYNQGEIGIQLACQSRYKSKRYLLMGPGLLPPPTRALLPANTKVYQSKSEISSDKTPLMSRVLTMQNFTQDQQFISVESATSKTEIPVGSQTKTCKELFQLWKIKPERRCRWRVIKYGGNVVSLTNGKRSLILTRLDEKENKSIKDLKKVIDVLEIDIENNGGGIVKACRGAYWIC